MKSFLVAILTTCMLAVPVFAGDCLVSGASGDVASGSGFPTTLTNITLEAWVYHDTLPSRIERYVSVGNEVAVIRHNGATATGQVQFYIKTGGTLRSLAVDNAITAGGVASCGRYVGWHHYATVC